MLGRYHARTASLRPSKDQHVIEVPRPSDVNSTGGHGQRPVFRRVSGKLVNGYCNSLGCAGFEQIAFAFYPNAATSIAPIGSELLCDEIA
jgi:hypothetical protein